MRGDSEHHDHYDHPASDPHTTPTEPGHVTAPPVRPLWLRTLAVRPPFALIRKVVLGVLAILIVAFCVGLVVIRSDSFREWLRDRIVAEIEARVDARVRIGRLSFKLMPTEATLEDLSIEPTGAAPLLHVQRVRVRVRPLALFRQRVELEHVRVDGVEVTLDVLDGVLLNAPKLRPRPPEPPSKWRVSADRVIVRQTDVRAAVRGSEGPRGRSLRRALAAIARMRRRAPPTGAPTMVARLSGLDVEVRRGASVWDAFLLARSGAIDAPGVHESLGRFRTRVRFDDAGTLVLDHLEVNLGATEVALLARGRATDLYALVQGKGGRADGKVVLAVDASAVRNAFPRLPRLRGMLKLDVDGAGSGPDDFEASGRLEWQDARLGTYRLGDVQVALAVDPRGASFDQLRAEFLRSPIRASGRLGFATHPTVEAKLSMADLPLRRLLAALEVGPVPVDLIPSGTLEVQGRLLRSASGLTPDLSVMTRLSVRDLLVRRGTPPAPKALFIPDARVDGRVVVRGTRVQFDGMRARIGRSDVRVRGDIDAGRRTLALDVRSRDMRLESVGTIAGLPWSGRGAVRAAIRGSMRSPNVLGTFDIEGLSFAGYDLDRAAGQIDFAGRTLALPVLAVARGATRFTGAAALELDTSERIHADLNIVRGNTRDLLKVLRLPPSYASRFYGQISGDVHLRGSVRKPEGWGRMRLRDVSAQGFAIHEVEAKGAYTALGWAVEAVRVRQTKDAGELLATGTISRKGELNLKAVTNGVTLSRFDLPELRRLGVEGDAFVTVDVGGTIQQPSGVGRVVLSNFKLRNQPQEDTRFDFNLRGDRVDLEGHLLGERVALNARLQVKRPFPFAGQVTVRDLDVGLFAGPEIGQRLAPLSGRGEFTGLATRLRDTKGRFIVDVVKADLGPNYSLRNKRPLVLRIEGERVTLEPVELAGRETLFAVSGSRLPSGEIDFNVDGRADFRLLGFYLPRLQRPAGLLRLKLRIGGTPAEPSFLGSGEILQGRFGVETFPHRLTDVEGKLVFTQNRVVVQELTGKFADGTLRGDGEVELARFVPSSFRFNVKLDEAALRFPEFLPARVAGNLQLTGTPAEQVLSGEIQVLRARFTRDIKLEELILKRKRIVPQVFEKSKDRLRMDVRVVARDDIRVINNIGDLEFQAEGGVRGSVTRPIPYGIVRLARPANVRFFKKLFKIERIYVVAKEEDRIDPYFDVEGVTRVRNIDIILTIKGRLSDYKLDFTCGAGLSTADCLSLMQVGLTLKELNAVQPGKTGISTAVDAISGLVGFDEKVAERLPIFDTFRIGSGYSEYSAAIVPLVTIGKELPGGIRLYGTTSLIDPSKDFRAQVEYDIVKNLSGVLEFVNLPRTGASGSTVGSSFGNLGVDLRWRFEF